MDEEVPSPAPVDAAKPAHRVGDELLLVDDDPDILDIYRMILEEEGYVVRTAISGAQAIVDARRYLPDLILLDLMMPGTNGIAVCTALRSRRKTAGIPIIFLSAADETHMRVKSLEAGGDDYIVKGSVSIEELLARMVVALRRSRGQPPAPETEQGEETQT